MKFIKAFAELSKKDVGSAGGKGASLGEMTQAGLAVPTGFVVLAAAFDRFLEETDIDAEIDAIMHSVKQKDINSVDRASHEIRAIIHKPKIPEDISAEILKHVSRLHAQLVAVRSSATAEDSSTASWAGELETYLNVPKSHVLESVKKCWSSLFTPRAIFYRFEKKLHKQIVSVAVVVQKMVQSEISGICFTVHPVTKDHQQMIIEAGWGLGEAIVSGMITPDTYIVHKGETSIKMPLVSKIKNKKLIILDKTLSEQKIQITKTITGTRETAVPKSLQKKQKLTDTQIVKLATLCKKIEDHYSTPQDIEWAFEKNKFYITQSRPITTL